MSKEPLYPHVTGNRQVLPHNVPRPKRVIVVVAYVEAGTIADLNTRHDLDLVTDSQDVALIKDFFGNRPAVKDFDGFFVKVQEGDFVEVYGFEGNVPYLYKHVYKIAKSVRTK